MKRTAAVTMLRRHKTWLIAEINYAEKQGIREDDPLYSELRGRYNAFLREEKTMKNKKK